MKIRDPEKLWQAIQRHNLNKHLGEFSLEDMQLLADLLSLFCEGEQVPWLNADGNIVTPFAAPYFCRWWQRDMTPREKYDLIVRLGGEPSRYMDQRAIDMALGKCDRLGRPLGQKQKEATPYEKRSDGSTQDENIKHICDTCEDREICEYAYDKYNSKKCLLDRVAKTLSGKF